LTSFIGQVDWIWLAKVRGVADPTPSLGLGHLAAGVGCCGFNRVGAEKQVLGKVFSFHNPHENFSGTLRIAGLDGITLHKIGDRANGAMVFGRNALDFHGRSGAIGGEAAGIDRVAIRQSGWMCNFGQCFGPISPLSS
jgi:hypothetical protein